MVKFRVDCMSEFRNAERSFYYSLRTKFNIGASIIQHKVIDISLWSLRTILLCCFHVPEILDTYYGTIQPALSFIRLVPTSMYSNYVWYLSSMYYIQLPSYVTGYLRLLLHMCYRT